jgi:hypothetical protein
MYQIIDKRGSGKTSRLMLLAKENNGILVCSNPQAMEVKAHAYGIIGLDFVSYANFAIGNYDHEKPCFIDELDLYVKHLCSYSNLSGYSLSLED